MTTAREKWIEVKASQFAASAEPRSLEQTEQFARDAMALADQTRQEHPDLRGALEEALHLASDEHEEVFSGDLRKRESAIIAWKRTAQAALASKDAELAKCANLVAQEARAHGDTKAELAAVVRFVQRVAGDVDGDLLHGGIYNTVSSGRSRDERAAVRNVQMVSIRP